ncbi:MAG: pseudouridine synthase [Hyphomicrobiaceae bacterium]|nr:pseudouridine synthase [Hyphomicrobiaceae bacterium]
MAKKAPKEDNGTGARSAGERIAKVISRAGAASRRDAERLIADGRVTLNGTAVTTPATLVGPEDTIAIDGAPLPARERTRLFLYHKPKGLVVAARDPEGRPTVQAALDPALPRLQPVGRLDINTEGLLLLTNDGGLKRVLELPSTGWVRRYRVRCHGTVALERLEALKNGITVEGVRYGPVDARLDRVQGANSWLTLGLREGKNREVKNILAALGLTVTRLIRISYGPFQLGELRRGAVEEVRGRILKDQLGKKLTEASGADFEAPLREDPSRKPPSSPARAEGRPARKPAPAKMPPEPSHRPPRGKGKPTSSGRPAPRRRDAR